MVPIVIVTGRSNSGKTTLIVKMITELKRRGYKVGTIKHHEGDFEMDKPGKDTWKHAQAGADAVAMSSSDKLALIKKVKTDTKIDSIAELMNDVDIIICEGYKHEKRPKIEVLRIEKYKEPLSSSKDDVIAIVSDRPNDVSFNAPVLSWDDARTVCDLIERRFL
jgi:molybdopterin-guanine dinucleotide biosynthesis protein B